MKSRATMSRASGYFDEEGYFPSPDLTRYDYVNIKQDPGHSWLDDLRSYQKMLAGEVLIPHGALEIFEGRNKSWYTSQPAIIFISDCDVCREAFCRRFNYQKSIGNLRIYDRES